MLHTTPPKPAALAQRPDPAGPLAVATPTTRRLADASLSVNTRRAYAGALRRLDTWRGTAPVDDASAGRLPRHDLRGGPRARHRRPRRRRCPVSGHARRPAGPRRGRDRPRVGRLPSHGRRPGPGPGRPADARTGSPQFSPPPPVPARTAVASNPTTTAHRRGRLDAVIAGLLFMGGLRRSEVAAVRWADVTDATRRRRRACSPCGPRKRITRGTPPTCGI